MATANLTSPIFRPDFVLSDHCYFEKRQLFLRSYHFCRKRGIAERIKFSLVRVKRLIWQKLQSARKFRRLVWTKLRHGYGRRRFYRLINRWASENWWEGIQETITRSCQEMKTRRGGGGNS